MAKIRALLSVLFVAGACSSVMAQTPAAQTPTPPTPSTPAPSTPRLDTIKLPPGFSIELYASDVRNARSMVLSPNGTLFVGSRIIGVGNVYAVVDRNKDNKADDVIVIAKGLNMPNGMAFRNGSLFVADTTRMLRYDNIEAQLNNPPAPVTLYENFPNLRLHQWHFIAFGPDGLLYVPIGSPCTDYCDPTVSEYKNPAGDVIAADKRFASIMRMKPDGTGQEIFASGIRNTVGFDWHPGSKDLYFTDNSRDWASEDLPEDELNRAHKAGLHFGSPFCYQGDFPDPEFGWGRSCSEFEKPVLKTGPHSASLGMRFYTGDKFPAKYKNAIFMARHGSWNRSQKFGGDILAVFLNKDGSVKGTEVFISGFLENNSYIGRPVDVLFLKDGTMLISDDFNGAVWRVSYGNQKSAAKK